MDGRRLESNNAAGKKKVWYYYNDKWQVTAAYDNIGDATKWIYGNYIDEVLVMIDPSGTKYYYCHDQLYSPVVLVNSSSSIEDRYEYDVYGACRVLNADFSADADGQPDCGNPGEIKVSGTFIC